MKKRIFAAFMAVLMLASVLPMNIFAADSGTAPQANVPPSVMENTNQADGVILRKSVWPHEENGVPDGTVDVILEAYTTGVVTQSMKAVPTDIVLVLDVSGSMNNAASTTTTTVTTYNAANGTSWRYNRQTYYGFQPTQTTYYVNTGTAEAPHYVSVSQVNPDSNNCYYYSYADGNDNTVYVYPQLRNYLNPNREYTYDVVQFYTRNVTTSETVTATSLDVLKEAVDSFIESTHQKNVQIAAENPTLSGAQLEAYQHRISIVKFAGDQYAGGTPSVTEGDDFYDDSNGYEHNYSQVVKNLTVVNGPGHTELIQAMDSLRAVGATAIDSGMVLAQKVLEPANAGIAQRNKVVLVFSDGVPTHGNEFSSDVANDAIGTAKTIKETAKVYAISVAKDSDVENTTSNLNKFFHYVSSNYPNASNLSTPGGNGNPAAGYYMVPTDTSSLSTMFQAIAENIEAPTVELGESASVVDTMSAYFTIPAGTNSVSLYMSDRVKNSDGTWGWSEAIQGTGLSCTVAGKTLQVHGFDYDENYVSDTPRTKGSNTEYYGTALIIKINAAPDYNTIDAHAATFADGYIPSNDGTANLLNSNSEKMATVDTPYIQANTVTYQYTDPTTKQTVTFKSFLRLPGAEMSVIGDEPAIHGYTFTEWTTQDATVAADGSYKMPEGDVVFRGEFVANKHDVTYTITGYNPGATAPAGATDVDFGSTVDVAEDLTFPGYTFTGWMSNYPTITSEQTSFVMPDHDVELIGYFTANSGVPYKTIHYIQNLDGTYSVKETVNGAGVTDTIATAATRVYEGFTLDTTVMGATVQGVAGTVDTVSEGKITADGQLTLHQFHTRNKYTVTYAYEGSVPAGAENLLPAAQSYYHGQTVSVESHAAQDAVKDHVFTGWHTLDKTTVTDDTAEFTMPQGNITLYGHFSAKENVPFHIHHYLQKADKSYPDTPNYTGTSHEVAGTKVTDDEFIRTIPGYTFDPTAADRVDEGIVSEDPVLTLKLYYTINTHDVRYEFENTVPAGATPPAGQTDVAYNTIVTVADPVNVPGYIFSGWRVKTPAEVVIEDGDFAMPDEDVVLVGSFTARTNTPYRIEYYWQNAEDDGYTLHESQDLAGTTDATATIPEKSYDGFTFNPNAAGTKLEGVITADGQLVLRRYYDRLTYKVVYKYEDSTNSIPNRPALPEDTKEYRYGATVKVADVVSMADYEFIGWYSKQNGAVTPTVTEFKMPIPYDGKTVILWGDFYAKSDVQYTIEHYLEIPTAPGTYPTTPGATGTSHGVAGTMVYAKDHQRTFTGYTYDETVQGSVIEGTISESPILVLKLYYKLNRYTVSYEYTGDVPATAKPTTAGLAGYKKENVPYNTLVQVEKPAEALGYIFSGWMIKERAATSIENGQFLMPDQNVTLIGSFTARTNNAYKVEYYWQNTEGDGFTLYETDVYNNGTTGATVDALEKTYIGLRLDKSVPGTVASGVVVATTDPANMLTLKLYYVRDTYTVEYKYESDVDGAPALPEPKTYRFGQKVTVADDASLEHYSFHGWYTKNSAFSVNAGMASFTMPAENLTLWGEFKRIEGVHYKVEHYLMGDDGNYTTPVLTEEFENGIAGETVTGTPKKASVDARFTGYVHDPAAPGSVLSGVVVASSDPDYPLTLKLYYKRNTYRVIYVYEGVLPANRTPLPAETTAEYLSKVQIASNAAAEGYTFSGWKIQSPAGVSITGNEFVMPAADVTLVGSFNVNPQYDVEYYLQSADDPTVYVKDDTTSHSHTAPIGKEVSAHSYVFEGYTENTTHPERVTSGIIPATGKLVLKLYYDLNKYTVTYVFENPVPAGAQLPPVETKYAGTKVQTPTPSVPGYIFSGWTVQTPVGLEYKNDEFTMPAANVVLKGKFTAGEAVYKIEHYLMNDQGTYDNVVPHTESKTGVVGDSVRATTYKPYLDMGAVVDTAKTVQDGKWEGVVSPDASAPLVLKLYYSREPAVRVIYHYEGDLTQDQWRALGWPDLPTDGTAYYVGAAITVKGFDTIPADMAFEGWHCSDPSLRVAPNGQFTAPRMNGSNPVIHLYGRWMSTLPQDFTVKYFIDGVEQTQYTKTYPLDTPVTVMANVENTASHSYTPWSTPTSATEGVEVVFNSDGTFTMHEHGEVHIRCVSVPIQPVATYNVRYYLDGRLYWEGGYELFERHFIIDAPLLPPNVYFSGWSAPRTVSGNRVRVLNDRLGRPCFTMPADTVVLYGTTSTSPIYDGAISIEKVVDAPAGFDGKDTFTFHVYLVANGVKELFETVSVTVDAESGRGKSDMIYLPRGMECIVEEAGAGMPGYILTTTVTDEAGDAIGLGQSVTVGPRVKPTELTFTNTYAELSLETRDHFGYIIGYPDETVRPDDYINRAEVATIFFRLLTDAKRAEYWSQSNTFADVPANAWYNNAISTLVNAGALSGYEDNTFRPENPITRAELVKIAMSFYGTLGDNADAFNDVGEHWAAAFINAAAELGFVSGYGDDTFQPDRYVTRAEAIKIINRTLNRAPHKDHLLPDMITWVDNADTDAWYYAEIQEATNSHMYYRDNTHEVWEKIRPIRDWAELEKQWSNAHSGKQ